MRLPPLTTSMIAPMCLLLASTAALAQPVSTGDDHLSADRPEAWAMNYFAATTLLTGFGAQPVGGAAGASLAAEIGQIPRLSDTQTRIGLNGVKQEDLNKSPVFGRLRLTFALGESGFAELGYTPPVTLNGSRTNNVVSIGLGARLFEVRPLVVAARLFGQRGAVTGDITCPAELANVSDPVRNPYGCQAASNDRMTLNYYGAEATAAIASGAWQFYGGGGAARTDLTVQVDALTSGTRDRTRLLSTRWLPYGLVGVRTPLGTRLSAGLELLYVPLYVRRAPNYERTSDPLTSARLQLRYLMD